MTLRQVTVYFKYSIDDSQENPLLINSFLSNPTAFFYKNKIEKERYRLKLKVPL